MCDRLGVSEATNRANFHTGSELRHCRLCCDRSGTSELHAVRSGGLRRVADSERFRRFAWPRDHWLAPTSLPLRCGLRAGKGGRERVESSRYAIDRTIGRRFTFGGDAIVNLDSTQGAGLCTHFQIPTDYSLPLRRSSEVQGRDIQLAPPPPWSRALLVICVKSNPT